MPHPRLLRAAVAAAALASALTPFGSTAATRCADEGRRLRLDGWTVTTRPAWTLGEQKIVGWAAGPFVDGFLLATNGTAVARSLDAGCSWEEVYVPGLTLDEAGLGRTLSEVFDVAVPPSKPGRLPSTAYAVVSNSQRGMVVTSDDHGETWVEQPSAGLPPVVALHSVHVSPDPRTAFVLGEFQMGAALVDTSLFVTRDGGLTFAPVQRGILVTEYTQLALDPVDPRQVWGWDESKLYHSKDGGATFTAVDIPGPIATVDVWRYPPSRPPRVHAYRVGSPSAYRTDDGGESWLRVRTDGEITGAASHYDSGALATTSDDGVVVNAPGVPSQVVSPRGLVLTDLAWQQQMFALELTLYGSNGIDLYLRRFTPEFKPAVKPKLPPVRLRSRIAEQLPTTLRPHNEVVRLKPGQRRTLTYRLDLAPAPTPLDIFFATDSTGSMSGVIASLRSHLQDIIDDLADAGIDVHFGVGDFKDYPYPGFGSHSDHPYKRFRKIGPIDDELERAIAAIAIGGGNGLNSALTATYQAATGHGQRRIENGEAAGWWVEPGQGAEWRSESLKVMVIAADVRSRDPQTDENYPGPTYKTVIDALNVRGIEHVGLAVGSDPAEPKQSLGRVSRGTGTVAPPGGTDCDDDGEVDIAEGGPLVCELSGGSGTNLAPAIVGMLHALEDRQPVSLDVNGDQRVARLTSTAVFDAVNVKARNKLTYTVEASCGHDTAGETFRHVVTARVASRTITTTGLTVECEALPVGRSRPRPPVEDFPPPPVRALVAAAVPPPPPPPAPVPQPQPQPNPNANPNANPQPVSQVQAGIAPQDQAQAEMALAHTEVRVDEELAMSGLRDGDAAARVVVCAGMVLAAGAAYGLKRRSAPAPSWVRSSG